MRQKLFVVSIEVIQFLVFNFDDLRRQWRNEFTVVTNKNNSAIKLV